MSPTSAPMVGWNADSKIPASRKSAIAATGAFAIEQAVPQCHARGREQQQPPVAETIREGAAGLAGAELAGSLDDEQHARGRAAEPCVAVRPDHNEREHRAGAELAERPHRHQSGELAPWVVTRHHASKL